MRTLLFLLLGLFPSLPGECQRRQQLEKKAEVSREDGSIAGGGTEITKHQNCECPYAS